MRKPDKKETVNLFFSAFLILAFIVCAHFFTQFTANLDATLGTVINICIMPLNNIFAGNSGTVSVITALAAIAFGYGIPYTFFSGFELASEDNEEASPEVLEGGVEADIIGNTEETVETAEETLEAAEEAAEDEADTAEKETEE